MLKSLCAHTFYIRITNIECMFTHMVLHAAGPSGSMTPPAIPLAAPSTPRTQPLPSTSAAAALRNQPATTSQVVLVVPLLELVQFLCCMHAQYHQHCITVVEVQVCPAAEVVQHALSPVERRVWGRSAAVGCNATQIGKQKC